MLAFAAVAAIVTVTPGLDTVLVLRVVAVSGRGAALCAAGGIGLGCLFWAGASGLGITAILTASQLAYNVLRLAGAAYLFWLGVRALKPARHRDMPDAPAQRPNLERPLAAFRRGLLTNLLNPKIGVFYLSILPQFLPTGVNPLLASILLALVHDIEGITWFALLILLAHRASGFVNRPAVRRRFDRITGVVFIGFGLRLAVQGAPH
jgi:threonine/homoserine/homoserine lactone efflux protein